MSDQSQGEGWWQASDGKWYPPPRPDAPAPPTTQPFGEPTGAPSEAYGPPTGPPVGAPHSGKKRGLGAGPIIGMAVAAAVIVGLIAFFVTRDDGKKNNASTERSGQTDESNQTQGVPSGFKTIKNEDAGVSIAVPRNFSETDPSQFANSDAQSEFRSENSELAPLLSSGNAFLRNSVLAASGSVDGTPAFVVVAKSPQPIDTTDSQSASELESELQSELATVGGSDITTDPVTLPAGPAFRVQVTLEINAAATSGTVRETIYFVTVGRTTWAILGVTVDGTNATDLFDQIAKTFSVTG
jgi:hypothetical protein